MLIQEMHNKVEVRLQKMASHVYDWIQSEQIDSFLNDNILAYVKNKTNSFSMSGKAPFERNIKNLEDLNTLLVKSPALLSYYEEDYFKVRVPGDYLFLVECSVDLSDKCNYDSFPNTVSYQELFADFDLPFNVQQLLVGANLIAQFPGYGSQLFKFANHNILNSVLNNSIGDIYKEKSGYKFIQKPGQSESNLTVTSVSGSSTVSFSSKQWNVIDGQDIKSPIRTRVIIRRAEEFTHYFNHPFARTSSDAPVATINNNFIEIHSDKRFILRNTYLRYIRKPEMVNLSLGIDCDLPEHTHQEIVDLTVADMLETIESGRLQSRVSLNTLNE